METNIRQFLDEIRVRKSFSWKILQMKNSGTRLRTIDDVFELFHDIRDDVILHEL